MRPPHLCHSAYFFLFPNSFPPFNKPITGLNDFFLILCFQKYFVMKKMFIALCLFSFAVTPRLVSQSIAISNDGSAPDNSSMLDIKSSTKGFLMPRTSTVARLAMLNPAKGLAVYDTTAGGYYFYDGSAWAAISNGKNLWAENGNSIYNVNSGFVGLGISTPRRRLHVHDASFGYVQMSNNSMGTNGTDGCFVGAFQNDLVLYNQESNGNIKLYIDGALRATLDSTGRFGIGKLPESKLDVLGDLRLEATSNSTAPAMRFYGGATGASTINFYKDLNAPVLGASIIYSATSDYLSVSNGTGAYFTPTGMGISTISPLSKLHIFSGQDAGLSNTTNGFLMLGSGSGTNIIFDNNEIMARNNGATAPLTFQNDGGSVRIGNVAAPAGYLFAVNGKMIGEELKVQLSGNWPDYVFKPGYELKSFDGLRKFIGENNHLPNIPPAEEVEKNGIEVGDMQKRMMEKIEELTLYILELEKRLAAIEKQK
jgi:hypothetical protein